MMPKSAVPKSWEDLLDPRWRDGKICLDLRRHDWFYAMMEVMGADKGKSFMERLRAQKPTFRQGNSLIQQLMTAGEFPLALTYAHTVEYTRSKDAPIDWVAPGPLPGLMVGVGLTAQAPHPSAARLFVDFLLSKEGQQLYQSAGRLVARSDLPQDENMKVRGAQIVPVDPAWAENFDEDSKLMKEIFAN